MPVEAKIVEILKKNKIAYEVVEHEPVYTNPAMAEALGVSEADTVSQSGRWGKIISLHSFSGVANQKACPIEVTRISIML